MQNKLTFMAFCFVGRTPAALFFDMWALLSASSAARSAKVACILLEALLFGGMVWSAREKQVELR